LTLRCPATSFPHNTQTFGCAGPEGEGKSTAVSADLLLPMKQLHGAPADVVSVAPTTPPQSGHIISPAINIFL
jgi:putative protein kinase ArgK-like GTPase of G3E family